MGVWREAELEDRATPNEGCMETYKKVYFLTAQWNNTIGKT